MSDEKGQVTKLPNGVTITAYPSGRTTIDFDGVSKNFKASSTGKRDVQGTGGVLPLSNGKFINAMLMQVPS
jgi:hypothetical protein